MVLSGRRPPEVSGGPGVGPSGYRQVSLREPMGVGQRNKRYSLVEIRSRRAPTAWPRSGVRDEGSRVGVVAARAGD